MLLLLLAAFGFIVPNGFFIYWLLYEFNAAQILNDKLALGFILDCVLAMALLAYYFAKRPIGSVGWQWFVVLSFAGGLGFSLPLYFWLNQRHKQRA